GMVPPSVGSSCTPPRNALLRPVPARELLLQRFELRQVMVDDVGLSRMEREVILMVILGLIELVERRNFGGDGLRERLRRGELRDVALRELLLFGVRIEDRRAVLRAD